MIKIVDGVIYCLDATQTEDVMSTIEGFYEDSAHENDVIRIENYENRPFYVNRIDVKKFLMMKQRANITNIYFCRQKI